MQIKTLWITRKSYNEAPELLVAQDEYSAEDNPEWFDERTAHELKAVGSDLADSRVIMLEVDDTAIEKAFAAPVLRASVQNVGQDHA